MEMATLDNLQMNDSPSVQDQYTSIGCHTHSPISLETVCRSKVSLATSTA